MKKYLILIGLIVFFGIFAFMNNSLAKDGYNLTCDELPACSGGASCGGSGYEIPLCTVVCTNGNIIICNIDF